MKRSLERLRRLVILVLASCAVGVSHAKMDTAAKVGQGDRFVPEPAHARLSSLGFDLVVSDFYWLQALQVVGGAGIYQAENASLIIRLIDLVTSLDPWVGHPYRFAAVWLTDSEASVREANRLLERGVAHDPLDWRNRYHLGFNHFFYLEDQQTAAEVLAPAVTLEGAPRYLGPLVARLRASRAGGLELAAGFLDELSRGDVDEYTRAEVLKALDEILTERRARYLDAARTEYWKRHGRDIERVEDLLAGPNPVLRALPRPHPHFEEFHWLLDDETGQIVSSYYKKRYQLHVHPADRARQERWRALREARQEQAS